jgi:hypothetical protein
MGEAVETITPIIAAALVLALLPLPAAAQGYAEAPPVWQQKEDDPVEALQERMEARPDVADEIRGLQSDPQFQDVLSDPDIRKALESGDTAALLANPKINNLTNHPAVQDITKKLSE